MRRPVAHAVLAVSILVLAIPACGGSTSRGGGSGEHSGGGPSTTGGATTSGGQATTGGRSTGGSGGEVPDVCSLPKQAGGAECDALIPSFWHNPKTDECERYDYGGCNATANHFESLAACQAACGGRPSIDACDRATDCALTSPGCCAACEPLEITDLISINSSHLSDKVCDVACGPCPPLGVNQRATGRYFISGCVAHQCKVVDIRETELTACNVDSDCRVRLGAGCCEACTGDPVAVNGNANICPDGPVPCLACAPAIPPGYAASCVLGRCTLSEPPCTLAHPCP